MLYGVDVHDGYQAGLSFTTLKSQGYSFAAVKFTEGTGFVRDQADEWIERARAAGLIPGAYHWLNAADGAAQARWFFENLKKVGGPEGLLIQCDNEDDATWQVTQDWAAEWKRLSGGHPFLMYSGRWWWGPRGWPGASLTPYLWDSRYLTADTDTIPDDPEAFAARIPADWWRLPNRWPDPTSFGYGGWSVATILQCSSKLDAGGLANNVDFNATKLTREQLLALTTAGGTMNWSDPLQLPQVEGNTQATATAGSSIAYTLVRSLVTLRELRQLAADLAEVASDVAELKARAAVDAANLKQVLTDPDVLAATAKAVVDEEHRRSAE